jgi:nitroreductase
MKKKNVHFTLQGTGIRADYPALMAKRTSCRSFSDEPLSHADRQVLADIIREPVSPPFGTPLRFVLIDRDEPSRPAERKSEIGTYGVIRGANTYIAGICPAAEGGFTLEDYGYVFEHIIIRATGLGLGTCWLGGTFSRSRFAEAACLKPDERLPCVTPVGYPAASRTVIDRFMRKAARSSERKPPHELFFSGSFSSPLHDLAACPLSQALEMVRAAPSASNKQPWRVVFDAHRQSYSFYLQFSPHYAGNRLGFVIQRIDIGIAMYHFAQTAQHLGYCGAWELEDPGIAIPPEHAGNLRYIASWKAEHPGRKEP